MKKKDNWARLRGNVEEEAKKLGNGYYYTYISVRRPNNASDHVPVVWDDRIFSILGKNVKIEGFVESWPMEKRIFSFLFPKLVEERKRGEELLNFVTMSGIICSKPKLITEEFGKDRAEIILENREGRRIPIVFYKENVKKALELKKGKKLFIEEGRFESLISQTAGGEVNKINAIAFKTK